MVALKETSPLLVRFLTLLGDEWGPLGVALTAAQLSDPLAVYHALGDMLMAAHRDGSEQKPGRKSLDATNARASVSVTFCMDDGCRYAAGHDGPHDITWQDAHSDGRDVPE